MYCTRQLSFHNNMHRPPPFHGVIFERNELFCNDFWFIFMIEKVNQLKLPNNSFHLSNISVGTFFNAVSCSRSTSYDSFVKKAIKKNYIALTKTCVNKDFRKSRIAFDVSLKVNGHASFHE